MEDEPVACFKLSSYGDKQFSDVRGERPRGFRVGHVPLYGASKKYLTRSIWLNNNNLKNAQGFETFMKHILQQPSALSWIDLSFNNITEVDDVSLTG
jgi:hypothetical protein